MVLNADNIISVSLNDIKVNKIAIQVLEQNIILKQCVLSKVLIQKFKHYSFIDLSLILEIKTNM